MDKVNVIEYGKIMFFIVKIKIFKDNFIYKGIIRLICWDKYVLFCMLL